MKKLQPFIKVCFICFISFFFMPAFGPSTLEARLLSGSVTERKQDKKIQKFLNSARKQYDSGKVQESLATYWKILEIDPQETFAFLELGEIYYELKIYDRAIELLEPGTKTASNEMDPETVCHYFCVLTNAYMKTNQIGLASKSLIKAAGASPKNPRPRKILGDIYLANNRIKSAYKAYKKALSFDPNYQPALEKIGELTTKYKIEIASIKPKRFRQKRQKSPTPQPLPVKPQKDSEEKKPEKTVTPIEQDQSMTMAAMDDRPMPLPIAPTKNIKSPPPVEKPPQTAQKSPDKAPTKAVLLPKSNLKPEAKPIIKVDQTDIETQIDKLLAGTAEEKAAAVKFFVQLGEPGIVEIEELLYDSDPEVRIIAIRAFSSFQQLKDRAITILKDSIDDPDPEVRKEIQKTLESLK